MLKLPWGSSLALRLAVSLSVVVTLFWLVSSLLVFSLYFEKAQGALRLRYESLAEKKAREISEILLRKQHDIKKMLVSWRSMTTDGFSYAREVSSKRINSVYIDTNPAYKDSHEHIGRAFKFIDKYGIDGLGIFVNTFVVLPGGMVVSNKIAEKNQLVTENLNPLTNGVEVNGVIWSKPFHSNTGQWYIVVAQRDTASNTLIGITVQLPSLFMSDVDSADQVWVAADNKPITQWPEWVPDKVIALASCGNKLSVYKEGIYVVCRKVEPTGWHLIALTPAHQIMDSAFSPFMFYMLIALLLLITLLALLYLVLHRGLGTVLARVVDALQPQSAVSDLKPIEISSNDEIGQMAQAYNRLLRAVKSHYAEMEARVANRTAELNEAKRRAELASANKSEQLNDISHEIRTPLNGIIGSLSLLRSTQCDNEQFELVDNGMQCSQHLLEIINNLLDFSRIDSGQMVVTPELLDPLPLIDQAMLTVQSTALEKHLHLRCLLAPTLPQKIFTDNLRLRQILINLLGNAVKFTHTGGVELTAWSKQQTLYFRVLDSGDGVPEERFEEIFIAFHQLDNHAAGSGLGLPISRSLARLLGGDLVIEKVAVGASFRLELPLEHAVVKQVLDRGFISAPVHLHQQLRNWGYRVVKGVDPRLEAPELVYLPGRLYNALTGNEQSLTPRESDVHTMPWSLQVLLVDDVDTNRDIVGRMLKKQGHRVFYANDGYNALEQGKRRVFDLVLMDVRMPRLSGEKTLLLWRDPANGMLDPDCPIVALTANVQPAERERLLQLGFNDYLTKPLTMTTLLPALEFVADQQLKRDMDLEPNSSLDQAVLENDPELLARFQEDTKRLLAELGAGLTEQDKPKIADAIHALKGLAGQAGLGLVFDALEHWESTLGEDQLQSVSQLDALRRLMQSELNSAL